MIRQARVGAAVAAVAFLLGACRAQAEDVYLQVEGDWKKTESGRELEKTFGFATGPTTYGLSYGIEVPEGSPPTKATSGRWVFTTGYIPLGMTTPTSANWYGQGFFTVRLDGRPIHDVAADFRTVRPGGEDALVEGTWPTPKGPVTIRLAMRGGDDKLLMQVALDPDTKAEQWEVELRCYPHAFSEPRDRRIATASRDVEAPQSVDLDLAREPWVLYYDKIMDGDPTGAGPCGLVYVPDEVASAKVIVGTYPITTKLVAKPGGRRITVGLWDFTRAGDLATQREYLGEGGAMIARDVAAVAAQDWNAGVLPAAKLPESRVAMLAERVQKRRRPTPYDEMTRKIVTPHVAWANPLPEGPVRVLVVGQRWNQRETVELAQRLDLDYQTVSFSTAESVLSESSLYLYGSYDVYGYPRKNAIDVLADLGEKLRGEHDAIILSGFQPELIPEGLRARIAEQVQSGTGLVLLGTAGKILAEFGDEAQQVEWSPGVVPIEKLPVLGAMLAEKRPVWTAYTVGKGRVLRFHYPTAGRHGLHGLTPHLEDDDPDCLAFYDYYHALLAAGVLWASGREMPVRVRFPEGTGKVMLESQEAAAGARLEVLVDDRLRAVCQQWEQGFDLAQGTSEHAIPNLGPAAGARFVNVWVKKDGKVLGWGTAQFEPKTESPRIAAVELSQKTVPSGGGVRGKVRLSDLPEQPSLDLELRDALGRVVAERQLAPSGPDAPFDIPLRQPVTPLHEIHVRLKSRDRWLDQQVEYVGTTWEDDGDYHFLVWSSGQNRAVRHFINHGLSLGGVDWIDNTGLTGGDALKAETFCRNAARHGLWSIPYITRIHSDQKADRVRHPCLTDPKHIKAWTAGLRDRALGAARYGVPGYTLGDENFLVRTNSVDVCISPTCLAAFRKTLEARYGSLDELNAHWQSEHSSWDEVIPATLEEVRADPALWPRWALHRLFMDEVFTQAHAKGREAIRSVDPDARVGFDGVFDLNSWHGYDFYRLSRACDLNEVYAVRPPQIEYLRSWHLPGAVVGAWYNHTGNRDEQAAKWLAWHLLFHDFNSSWYWTSYNTGPALLFPDLRPTPQFCWMRESIGEIKSGIGKLLLGAERLDDGIAIHYSQASVHAGTLLGRRPDDAQWAFARLVEDLGYQHRMLSYEEIEQGMLQDYRVLLMPACAAISRKEAAAIHRFVDEGGLVVADTLPGFLEDDGYLPPTGLLDQTFGVSRLGLPNRDGAKPIRLQGDDGEVELSLTSYDTALKTDGAEARTTLRAVPATDDGTPAVLVHRLGCGTAVLLNAEIDPYRSLREKAEGGAERRLLAGLLAEAGLKPPVPVRPEGPWEIVRFADRDALYVCLLPDSSFPGEQRRPVRIELPRRAFVYDVRAKQALGQTEIVETTLAPGQPQIYALLPYDVRNITVKPAAEVAAGADLVVDVTLDLAPSQHCARHCIRIELAGPDGRTLRHYAENVITSKPAVCTTIPLAVNDPAGRWTIQATDVATARASQATFAVTPAASDQLSNEPADGG